MRGNRGAGVGGGGQYHNSCLQLHVVTLLLISQCASETGYWRTPLCTHSALLWVILDNPKQTRRPLTGARSGSERTLAVIWNSSCSFSSSWVCWMLEPVDVCVDR